MIHNLDILLYLLCAVPIVLLLKKSHQQVIRHPLRVTIIILFLLVIFQPAFRLGNKPQHVWLLVDRSASIAETYQTRGREIEGIVRQSMPSGAKLSLVDVADVASLRGQGDEAHYQKAIPETNLALGIDFALSKMSDEDSNRILLLTDGYSTQALTETERNLRAKDIALDVRLLDNRQEGDYRIELRSQQEVEPLQGNIISAQVYGEPETLLAVGLYRDDKFIARSQVQVRDGKGDITFFDRVGDAGTIHRYQARLENTDATIGFRDAQQANNIARASTRVLGEAPIILFSSDPADPLERELLQAGFRVRLVNNPHSMGIAELLASRLAIFNNIPSVSFPPEILGTIPFAVNELGLGVLMLGGESSFASGGYYRTPVEDILPVSLELREEERHIPNFLILVLDRSGSMGMAVQGASGSMQKMTLANEGVAHSIELLKQQDRVALFAVDTEALEIIPPTLVGDNLPALTAQARSVTVGGGGIYVYTALKAAWARLQEHSYSGAKHLILFSDAADSEEPGDYKNLIELMRKANVTISVIALGSKADPDANFLIDIAERGAGRIFFIDNALDLPAVFQQETSSFARSYFIKEKTGASLLSHWSEIAPHAKNITQSNWLSHVDGYNLTYLREAEGAKAGLVSQDEYNAPLLAWWRRGIGNVATITFPWNGPYSESTRAWKAGPENLITLVRWLKGSAQPTGLRVRSSVKNNEAIVEVFYNSEWESKFADQGASLSGIQAKTTHWDSSNYQLSLIDWDKIEPGYLRARIPLSFNNPWIGVVRFANEKIDVGPFERSGTEEWNRNEQQKRNLLEISKKSAGVTRLDVSTIWQEKSETRYINFTIPLALAILLLILLESLLTRLGHTKFHFTGLNIKFNLPKKPFRRKTSPKTIPVIEEVPKTLLTNKEPARDSLNEALLKAKRK